MAAQHDLGPHERTWGGFVKLTIYGTGAVALTLVLMAIFLL